MLASVTYPATIAIQSLQRPFVATVSPPGSKSITNRALALAALSPRDTLLEGALAAEDTQRMQDCLRSLGFLIEHDLSTATIRVQGRGGAIPARKATLFVGNSGTTARFISPVMALGSGVFELDGVARMRERPIGDLVQALQSLGVLVDCPTGCPPLTLHAHGLSGGTAVIRADVSSQFLSGLLLASPCATGETLIRIEGPILSAPYIAMTVAMVEHFGGKIVVEEDGRLYRVPPHQSLDAGGHYRIEPDASAASYFFAAAAATGGKVRVPHLTLAALQGDVAFVKVLEKMGCTLHLGSDFIEVQGPQQLQGVTVDMNAISDTVMTLAAIAPFATTPTVIQNVAHIRHKETDRLAAVATELQRLGVTVEERTDGLTIHPASTLRPAVIQTYDDHRMAMAFAITGLRSSGVVIANPSCVAKTYPEFFTVLEELCAAG